MRRATAIYLLLLLGLALVMPAAQRAQGSDASNLAVPQTRQTPSLSNLSGRDGDSTRLRATWGTSADSLRGRNGQRFTFVCPAGGSLSSNLWGTDLYTDDSSVCTAAAHAGLISTTRGGTVTIEIRPGESSYGDSERYGVTSRSYGEWGGSFVIVDASPADDGGSNGGTTIINWSTTATSLRGQNGQRVTYSCPANGRLGSVWGSDPYTDDSSICSAAVHRGLITQANGGTVTIEIQPGESSYLDTTRYGVTSSRYGEWGGSFVFVGGSPAPADSGGSGSSGSGGNSARLINWGTTATSMRGRNGQRVTYSCPPNGTLGAVWGSDTYTDDSSICSAAVHAGLITQAAGGTVVIEIRPGEGSYNDSARYGVTTNRFGEWAGSFVFVGGSPADGRNDPVNTQLQATWETSADSLRGRNGQRFTFVCPAGGRLSGRLWGTDFYTDDSSVCTAAVHAGLISTARGGTVTIEIQPGTSFYGDSTRYGVSSSSYGEWRGSFVFVGGSLR